MRKLFECPSYKTGQKYNCNLEFKHPAADFSLEHFFLQIISRLTSYEIRTELRWSSHQSSLSFRLSVVQGVWLKWACPSLHKCLFRVCAYAGGAAGSGKPHGGAELQWVDGCGSPPCPPALLSDECARASSYTFLSGGN